MNTTSATPPAVTEDSVPPRFPFLILLIVWLAIVLVTTLVTFILPEYFDSTARIKIGSDQPDIRSFSEQPPGTNAYDPHFLQTELETIQSELVLRRVIAELHLNDVWGKRYLDGGQLKTSETLTLLRGRLDLRPVRNTSLLDIRVVSENPREARDLANEIAKAYQAWRQEQFQERVKAGLKSLEQRAQEQDEKIAWTKRRLAEQAEASAGGRKPDYSDAQRELEDMIGMRRELTRRMNLEEIDLHLPRSGQVMILERAEASTKPFRPNKPLNITLGIIIGAVSGFLLAILVYVIKRWAHQSRPGNSGTNTLRGLRTFVQVSVALLVGVLVGYNCAMPWGRASLFFMLVFVLLGAAAIGYVAIAKTTPLPPKTDDRLGSI